jgi:hypothetical protein
MKLAQDRDQRQALVSAALNLQRRYVCHIGAWPCVRAVLYLHILKMRLTQGHSCVKAIIGRGRILHTIAVYMFS